MTKDRIIYIYPAFSSFVKKDIDFLNKQYQVIHPNHKWNKKSATPLLMIKQFFFLLFNIKKSKAVFVMFGGYWSYMPALMGKIFRVPVFIILGGTDCVSFPSINYGNLRKPALKLVTKWSYKLSACLLPVDESLVYCNYTYYEKRDYDHQGYKYFFPSIKTPYKVIYNGFDSDVFKPIENIKTNNSYITIASISDNSLFVLKVIDRIDSLAKVFSDCTFIIVGISKTFMDQNIQLPTNIIVHDFLQADTFKKYLQESEFYLQLSISEGFPNALCEAMLCNCIPIGSSVGAIPTIIDNTGFIMQHSETTYLIKEFKKITELASQTKMQLAEQARQRVIEKFDIKLREKLFVEVINEYSKK